MKSSRTALGLVVSAGLLLGGGLAAGTLAATGALAADTPSASPSAPSAPGAPGPGGHGRFDRDGDGPRGTGMGGGMGMRGLHGLGAVLHGEVVVAKPGGGTETLLVQRGTVTATTTDSVTVKSTDGFTLTWAVTKDTALRLGPSTTAPSALKNGTEVMAVGSKDGSGATARMLGVRPAGMPGGPGDRDGDGPDGDGPGAPAAPAPGTTTAPSGLDG